MPARATGQDRAAVFVRPTGIVIALADGAGGTSHGEVAAQALIDAIAADPVSTRWSTVIGTLDRDMMSLCRGQTTAVVVALELGGLAGCSVGDSGAWRIGSDIVDLTDGQTRKPLVGAGCHPFAFHASAIGGDTLLVASDGLLRYAKPQDIARIARGPDIAAAARALVELVRLRSGALQDDVSVVLCRAAS